MHLCDLCDCGSRNCPLTTLPEKRSVISTTNLYKNKILTRWILNIVCIGVITPRNSSPYFLPSLLLNLQTVQPPPCPPPPRILFRPFPLYIGFSCTPPLSLPPYKSDFSVNPHNIKIFHP